MDLIYTIIVLLSPVITVWTDDMSDILEWRVPDHYKNVLSLKPDWLTLRKMESSP